tara:strand:- start:3222 stop:4967 length:1746 start_codon:yes stop_codon:yes gene_type:complete
MNKVVTLIVLVTSLFSCVEKRDLTQNTVISHIGVVPESLHPLNKSSSSKKIIQYYTQKYIHITDVRNFKQIPILAKALPDTVGDLKTYSFELIEKAKWDDGTPILGKDVVFSVKMLICPLTNNPGHRSIYSVVFDDVWVDADNPRKVFYKSKELDYGAKEIFQEICILQKSFWDKNGIVDSIPIKGIERHVFTQEEKRWFENFNGHEYSFQPSKIVGAGQYQVSEYKIGSHVTLVKKKNHWTEGDTCLFNQAHPDKIIFREINDPTAIKLALMNQKLDAVFSIGTKTVSKLNKKDYFRENYYTVDKNRFVYSYLGLNMKPDASKYKPLFVNQKVRRAFAHAVPVDEIINIVYKGNASRQVSNTSPFNYRYNKSLQPIEYDIEKARKLLAEAGWVDTDGDYILDKKINGKKVDFEFKFSYMTGGSGPKEIFLMIKESLKKVGIIAVGNPMEFSTFYNNAQKHDFQVMAGGWASGSSYSNPDQLWSVANWENQGYNFTGFGDASSDSLIKEINININEEKHLQAHRAFQKRLYDEQPYVFLISPKKSLVIHNRFENPVGYMEDPSILLNTLKLKAEFKQIKEN